MSSRDIRRKYAQNYLKDPAVLFEMADCINPKETDAFLEIGPGHGALTNQINKRDIDIICVDIDSNNIDYMIDKFQGPANFKFINEDILRFELPNIDSKLRIVGNLPYNISTQIMIKFVDDFEKIEDMHFLVQKEVAQKVNGKISTKNWGKLALKISTFYETEVLFDVPPEAFDIKPKVNSSFIRFIPRKNLNYDISIKDNLFKIIDLAFSSKRKNIKNNLKSLNISWDNFEINPASRSENLSVDDFVKIAKEYKI